MWKAILCAAALAGLAGPVWAQSGGVPPGAVELANLREDVRGLTEQVARLSLRLEQVERDNADLRAKAASQNYATIAQLNAAVADLNRLVQAGDEATREQLTAQVGAQIKKLADQTNAALDSLAKGMAQRTPVQTTFSEDYVKDGIKYTVQKGDTLDVIAKKTGTKKTDIINANKIPDPSKILVGQTLFIPGGKVPAPPAP